MIYRHGKPGSIFRTISPVTEMNVLRLLSTENHYTMDALTHPLRHIHGLLTFMFVHSPYLTNLSDFNYSYVLYALNLKSETVTV